MTQFSDARRAARFALFLSIFWVAACGGDGGTTEPTDPPVITVTGVAENAAYPGAVTITFTADKGSYSATLDGQTINSGTSVAAPGAHVLIVTARSGDRTATQTVHFTIQGATGGLLIIRMLDLGTRGEDAPGDAILLTDSSAGGMSHVLIDAGPGLTANTDAYVSQRLTALKVDSLAIVVLTHAHGDHYLGMSTVLTTQKVKRFIYNGQIRTSAPTYTSLLSLAQTRSDSVIKITAVRDYSLGYSLTPALLKVLQPLPTFINTDTGDGTLLNEGSVGARLDMGTFNMFFTGDSEVQATARWRTTFADLTQDITILKVGHHGANNAIFDNGLSGNSAWLDHTTPTVSIISGNGTSHPRRFALARLQSQPGNTTYCTPVHGMITIRVTRTGAYTVTTEKGAGLPCVPGSTATT
ncbi:MAG: MBL fold metallo-hydrolase [Longimicrobiales bacterium]